MTPSRAAVVVIGSNSTRMLTADAVRALSNPVRGRVETRLFLSMDRGGFFSEEGIAGAMRSVCLLKEQAEQAVAEEISLLATSAARDAANTAALARAIRDATGLEMLVLDNRLEALLSYLGAVSALEAGVSAGVIDVGGGSVEVAVGTGGQIAYTASLQLGASRLYAGYPINVPEDVAPALDAAAQIACALPPLPFRPERWIVVGGTGMALRDIMLALPAGTVVEANYPFTRDDALAQLSMLAALPPEKRRGVTGLPAGREHILPTGLAALLAVMDAVGAGAAEVTARCNCDGFLLYRMEEEI